MTARETMLLYEKQKRQEQNRKKYHTDEIRQFSGEIVATSTSWNYKLTIYEDNSAAIYAKAKPGSGCRDCHYCGTDVLKYHLERVRPGWIITQKAFFDALNIPTENAEAIAEALQELRTA